MLTNLALLAPRCSQHPEAEGRRSGHSGVSAYGFQPPPPPEGFSFVLFPPAPAQSWNPTKLSWTGRRPLLVTRHTPPPHPPGQLLCPLSGLPLCCLVFSERLFSVFCLPALPTLYLFLSNFTPVSVYPHQLWFPLCRFLVGSSPQGRPIHPQSGRSPGPRRERRSLPCLVCGSKCDLNSLRLASR